MSRRSKVLIPDSNPDTDALWLAYEVATGFREEPLVKIERAAKLLGILAEHLPVLEKKGILIPAGYANKKFSVKR